MLELLNGVKCGLFLCKICLRILLSFTGNILVSSAVEDERCMRTDSTARIFDQLCDVSSSRSPDYGMFRLQMFNLLSKLDEIAEKTTKTLSPWLLALYTQEYESVDFMSRNRQNITWTNPSACELNAVELDGENDEEDGDEEMEVEQSNENENETEDVVNET
ncbi:unnamed protein product [Anisakis simplex]|uniref:Uncharacterized protein n=1 Tax=Anisakis simplex TaxID=6269 RepID=A0A3P6NEF9_ANISI|nr:unnamed protein product [Anisakis simplex]